MTGLTRTGGAGPELAHNAVMPALVLVLAGVANDAATLRETMAKAESLGVEFDD